MLIDYISPEHLPWIIVWMDWQIYAHPILLISTFIGVFTANKVFQLNYRKRYCIYLSFTSFFIGCYFSYGGGVG